MSDRELELDEASDGAITAMLDHFDRYLASVKPVTGEVLRLLEERVVSAMRDAGEDVDDKPLVLFRVHQLAYSLSSQSERAYRDAVNNN